MPLILFDYSAIFLYAARFKGLHFQNLGRIWYMKRNVFVEYRWKFWSNDHTGTAGGCNNFEAECEKCKLEQVAIIIQSESRTVRSIDIIWYNVTSSRMQASTADMCRMFERLPMGKRTSICSRLTVWFGSLIFALSMILYLFKQIC